VVEVEDKVEDKEDTIHFLPCCLVKSKCLKSYSVLCIANFGLQIRGVVYHINVFLESSHLIDLKVSFKSFASLRGGKFVAFYVKGQRLWSAIEDGQIKFFVCNEILRE